MKFLTSLSFCLLLLFLSFSQNSWSQQPPNQDYIILESGEIEKGKIVRSFDQSNYSVVKFISQSGSKKDLSPNDIQGFGLDNGRIFKSMKLPGKPNKVFVQQILTGTFNLLSHQDDIYIESDVELVQMYKSLEENNFAGRIVTNIKKPFVDDLFILFAGTCGTALKKNIEKTYYSDYGFLDLLIRYHQCENLPYQVHIENIPKFRLSPTISLGGNYAGTLISDRINDRLDIFEQQFFPSFQVGLRLHQIRNIPKFGLDLGVGVISYSNTVISQFENQNTIFTGTENFHVSSTFIPFSINYSFYRNRFFDAFAGVGVIYRLNKIESDFSILDRKNKVINTTTLEETRLTTYKEQITSPTFKLGTHIRYSKKLGIIVELQSSLLSGSYSVWLENNRAQYSEVINSLLIGIRY